MSRLRFAALVPIALLGSTIAHAAQYDCLVAFGSDTSSNCQPPIALEEFSAGDALVSIDMSDWRCLRVTAKIRDPLGWVMNIGNSYSNSGGAGDGGDFSNDSELEITFDELLVPESQGQGLLRVFDNEYTANAMPVLTIGDFIDRHFVLPDEPGLHPCLRCRDSTTSPWSWSLRSE